MPLLLMRAYSPERPTDRDQQEIAVGLEHLHVSCTPDLQSQDQAPPHAPLGGYLPLNQPIGLHIRFVDADLPNRRPGTCYLTEAL